MGEGLPFFIWRVDHWAKQNPRGITVKKTFHEYLNENCFLTTSGVFRTQTLWMRSQKSAPTASCSPSTTRMLRFTTPSNSRDPDSDQAQLGVSDQDQIHPLSDGPPGVRSPLRCVLKLASDPVRFIVIDRGLRPKSRHTSGWSRPEGRCRAG
jgi:hypothetical protein